MRIRKPNFVALFEGAKQICQQIMSGGMTEDKAVKLMTKVAEQYESGEVACSDLRKYKDSLGNTTKKNQLPRHRLAKAPHPCPLATQSLMTALSRGRKNRGVIPRNSSNKNLGERARKRSRGESSTPRIGAPPLFLTDTGLF